MDAGQDYREVDPLVQFFPAPAHAAHESGDGGDGQGGQDQPDGEADQDISTLDQLLTDLAPFERQVQAEPGGEVQAGPGVAPEAQRPAQFVQAAELEAFGQRGNQQGQ